MQYPVGGRSRQQGGNGIFTDEATGNPIRVWVDIRILGRRELLQLLTDEGAEIAPSHSDEDVPLMIISPASHLIFDLYCHPDWLKPTTKRRLEKQREEYGIEEVNPAWQSKVMLKRGWAEKCVAAGSLLVSVAITASWGELTLRRDKKTTGQACGQEDKLPRHKTGAPAEVGSPPETVEITAKSIEAPVSAIDVEPKVVEPAIVEPAVVEPMVVDGPNPYEELGPTEVGIPAQHNSPPPPLSPRVSESDPGSPARAAEASEDEVAMELDDNDEVDSALVEPPPPEVPAPPLPPSDEPEPEVHSPSKGSQKGSRSPMGFHPKVRRRPPPPETMFDGLMFYVDVDNRGRRQILEDITARGGTIVPQLDAATHALINYTPAKKVRWDPMIRSHTRKGTWFVTFDWIDECIREGELVAETCCLIPGGRTLRPRPIIRSDAGPSRSVPNRDIPTPHADGQSQQAAAIPNGVGIPARPSGALALPEKPVSASKASQDSSRRTEPVLPQGINDRDDIHQLIIRRVHLLDTGWTLERLCQRLAQMHRVRGAEDWWLDTFREWDQGRGLFENYSYPGGRRHPPTTRAASRNDSSSSSTPRPTEDHLPSPAAGPSSVQGSSSKSTSGPPRIPFGQPSSAPAAERDSSKLSAVEIDRTFRRWEAFYEVPRGKLSVGDLSREAQEKGIYSTGTWRNYYNEWARGGGRFANLSATGGSPAPGASFNGTGANADPVTPSTSRQGETSGQSRPPDDQAKQGIDTRMLKVLARTFERDYMPLYERKVGWEEITQRMRSDFEDDDPESLVALFKQWVKKEGDFAYLKTAKPSEPSLSSTQPVASSSQAPRANPSSSQPSPVAHNARKAAEEMAALFLPFTSRIADGLSNSRLGDMIHAQHPRLTASTWSLYIGAWRRNAANFANLPEHLQFRPPPASERKPTVPPTPTPTSLPPAATKRPASEESSAPTDLQGKKQKRSTAYTEEEEMAMAAHIFGRLPTPTAFRLADWVDFQKDHPARSAAAYAEHYRGYAARIDGYVESMGGRIRRKGDNGSPATRRSATERAGSEDSIVSVHVPRAAVSREVIVISDDSDDE